MNVKPRYIFCVSMDAGRWPTEVRPFTNNRRHVLRKLIDPKE